MLERDKAKVSCVMVTADRGRLCRRAILCYQKQTYPNKELIVVDDGREDLSPLLADLPADEIRYVKLEKKPGTTLGYLRNRALYAASGNYIAQWDDDDWYHPERLEKQVKVLDEGYDACCLPGTLMHIDNKEFFNEPYLGYIKAGVPGTIMHRTNPSIQYPQLCRAEDTEYLKQWFGLRYALLSRQDVYLFIRCFHGDNTWDKNHFLSRIRNTPHDLLAYVWCKYVMKDLAAHPRFQIGQKARHAFNEYLEDSYYCGIFSTEKKRPPVAQYST